MTHPPDLVERVAKAIYEVNPLYSTVRVERTDNIVRYTTEQRAVPWSEVVEDAQADHVCKELVDRALAQAIAALTEAGAWLTDRVARDRDITAQALKAAARDPAMYRTGGE